MARKNGRALRGEQLRASIPHGHWKTTPFVTGLRLSGLTAPMVLDGPINAVWFHAYVEQVHVPTLSQGDIVVMHNLGSHKGAGVRKAIEEAGATLLYLPPYSPDFNPSRRSSPSSKRCFAKPQSEASTLCGTGSAPSSMSSRRRNAPTSSRQQVMSLFEKKPL
jgi:transposase